MASFGGHADNSPLRNSRGGTPYKSCLGQGSSFLPSHVVKLSEIATKDKDRLYQLLLDNHVTLRMLDPEVELSVLERNIRPLQVISLDAPGTPPRAISPAKDKFGRILSPTKDKKKTPIKPAAYLFEGSSVECNYRGTGEWVSATITSINIMGDGQLKTYDVKYESNFVADLKVLAPNERKGNYASDQHYFYSPGTLHAASPTSPLFAKKQAVPIVTTPNSNINQTKANIHKLYASFPYDERLKNLQKNGPIEVKLNGVDSFHYNTYPKFVGLIADSGATVKPKHRLLTWLMKTIEDIYDQRYIHEKHDIDRDDEASLQSEAEVAQFPLFVVKRMSTIVGLKPIIEQSCWDLLYSTNIYREDYVEVEMFARFLQEYYDHDDLLFFLYVRSVISQLLKISFKGRWSRPETAAKIQSRPFCLSYRETILVAKVIFGADNDMMIRDFLSIVLPHIVGQKTETVDSRRIEISHFLHLAVIGYHQAQETADEMKNKGNAGAQGSSDANVTLSKSVNSNLLNNSRSNNNQSMKSGNNNKNNANFNNDININTDYSNKNLISLSNMNDFNGNMVLDESGKWLESNPKMVPNDVNSVGMILESKDNDMNIAKADDLDNRSSAYQTTATFFSQETIETQLGEIQMNRESEFLHVLCEPFLEHHETLGDQVVEFVISELTQALRKHIVESITMNSDLGFHDDLQKFDEFIVTILSSDEVIQSFESFRDSLIQQCIENNEENFGLDVNMVDDGQEGNSKNNISDDATADDDETGYEGGVSTAGDEQSGGVDRSVVYAVPDDQVETIEKNALSRFEEAPVENVSESRIEPGSVDVNPNNDANIQTNIKLDDNGSVSSSIYSNTSIKSSTDKLYGIETGIRNGSSRDPQVGSNDANLSGSVSNKSSATPIQVLGSVDSTVSDIIPAVVTNSGTENSIKGILEIITDASTQPNVVDSNTELKMDDVSVADTLASDLTGSQVSTFADVLKNRETEMMRFLCECLYAEDTSYSPELQNFVKEELSKALLISIEELFENKGVDYHREESLEKLDELLVVFLASDALVSALTQKRDELIAQAL